MKQNAFNLTGKTALVTGSSGGLGFAIATGLAEAGATVILNGRNGSRLQSAVEQLQKAGHNVASSLFDIRDVEAVKIAIATIYKTHDSIDILVNNAGVQLRGDLSTLPLKDWKTVIDTHLTGAFITTQAVVPQMIERKKGKIINICSLMSEAGRQSTGCYTAAKGGLKMLTKAMAVDWAKHGIQVNGIGPGYFLTDMTRKLADDPNFNNWVISRTPAGRWGRPEELVGPAVFLASEASSFVNGQIIFVDGGIISGLGNPQ
jgi:gluconate 5-dehydrogenase